MRSQKRCSLTSAVLVAVAGGLPGCGLMNRQVDAEVDFALKMAGWMRLYDAMHTNLAATNMSQLFRGYYPYKEHQRLSAFGNTSGFKVSVEEKYMFFWPRLTDSALHGDVICMETHSFRWGSEGSHRIYISKVGGDYRYWRIPEKRVEPILQRATQIVVPRPPIGPPPPPPPELKPLLERSLHNRYEEFVWNLSGALGQDSSMPVRFLLKVIAVIVTSVLTFFCMFFIRRARGRPRPERTGPNPDLQ